MAHSSCLWVGVGGCVFCFCCPGTSVWFLTYKPQNIDQNGRFLTEAERRSNNYIAPQIFSCAQVGMIVPRSCCVVPCFLWYFLSFGGSKKGTYYGAIDSVISYKKVKAFCEGVRARKKFQTVAGAVHIYLILDFGVILLVDCHSARV